MTLSAHERRELDCISEGLTVSDPVLAGLLDTFTLLTADEVMPTREQVGAKWQQVLDPTRRAQRTRTRTLRRQPAVILRRAGLVILVLVPLVALLAAVVVVFCTSNATGCRASLSTRCTQSAPSASSS